METAETTQTQHPQVSFRDGLGDRTSIVESTSGDTLEALRLCPALSANFAVERALRERVGRLIEFRHAHYARIWRVEGEAGSPLGLSLVSERPRGMRLAEMIQGIEERQFAYDFQVARSLIEQLVSAIASLHLVGHDVAHGTLGPERLIVTPHAGLVIVEHVLGPALEHLELTRTRLWQDFRIAIPSAAGAPRLDQRADTLQIGVVALALLLGRRLREEDFPARLGDLVAEVCQPAPGSERPPISRAFGAWLVRALQLDLRHSFQSAIEAQSTLDGVVHDESRPAAVRLMTATPRLAPVDVGAAVHEPTLEIVHQEEVYRREDAAHFGGLEPGSFETRREPAHVRMRRAARHLLLRAAAVLVAVTAVLGLAYFAIHRYAPTWLADHQATVLTFGSQYAGTEIIVDGKSRGRAPTEFTVTPGPHTIELRPVAKPKAPQPAAAATSAAPARRLTRK
jgi:hypothetical protein